MALSFTNKIYRKSTFAVIFSAVQGSVTSYDILYTTIDSIFSDSDPANLALQTSTIITLTLFWFTSSFIKSHDMGDDDISNKTIRVGFVKYPPAVFNTCSHFPELSNRKKCPLPGHCVEVTDGNLICIISKISSDSAHNHPKFEFDCPSGCVGPK